jgi:ABC-type branched-subunit amino acid transport system ATPase component
MDEPLLSVADISQRFGGLLAVDSASFDVYAGSITALIGPNGAGKTTLFAIISGFQRPVQGHVCFEGQDITGKPPHELARRGLARTFQIVQPFMGLTVRENIAVGAYLRHRERAAAFEAAENIARRLALGKYIDQPAGALTVGARKRLELARALATSPRLLLLDEVMAGLNPSEVRDLLPAIQEEVRTQGTTILLIEHVMQAVMNLSDRIHVLAEGRVIASGTPESVVENEQVIEAYLGEGAASHYGRGGRSR